jgi:hypothetical protein
MAVWTHGAGNAQAQVGAGPITLEVELDATETAAHLGKTLVWSCVRPTAGTFTPGNAVVVAPVAPATTVKLSTRFDPATAGSFQVTLTDPTTMAAIATTMVDIAAAMPAAGAGGGGGAGTGAPAGGAPAGGGAGTPAPGGTPATQPQTTATTPQGQVTQTPPATVAIAAMNGGTINVAAPTPQDPNAGFAGKVFLGLFAATILTVLFLLVAGAFGCIDFGEKAVTQHTPATASGASVSQGTPVNVDQDGDGIVNERDRCPREPETVNGFEDADGCADAAPSGATAGSTANPATRAASAASAAATREAAITACCLRGYGR